MAKLLTRNATFDEVSPTAHYEMEFERIVRQYAPRLFPEYHFVEFKPIVCSEDESARPDVALIHCDCANNPVTSASQELLT